MPSRFELVAAVRPSIQRKASSNDRTSHPYGVSGIALANLQTFNEYVVAASHTNCTNFHLKAGLRTRTGSQAASRFSRAVGRPATHFRPDGKNAERRKGA